ncbi:MAG: sulfotransferase family protein [Cyanobacteria bacterium]|nr:sulfotransferase family protein [Cyanobacteria bacterium CG_2015-16_32_12]NCO78583.1 sulfotransferase family protein [Cyanobacteria bacterium CG_2015-22_32_23]NCQ02975.1 sulfotransferase family protein [Cyanobacteria bacterium CG_2015-09_32_10]NCQ40820.1 sulfotransferase family protein [Cyanobacteria bacterium CG_2015-04_32_10]NCS83666.1 sulfotransferase family protein [Cyanobacteria bacterium CG_2015-02_32_10]
MIISHEYKFIFVKTRKTAGTTISRYLSSFCKNTDIVANIGDEFSDKSCNDKGFFNPLPEILKYPIILTKEKRPYLVSSRNPLKDFYRQIIFHNHLPAYQIRERIGHKIWNEYFKFCFDRNPWDKAISYYFYLNRKTPQPFSNFDDFLKRYSSFCWNYPIYTNPWNEEEILVDYIAKYENLSEELQKICERIGIPFNEALITEKTANNDSRKDKSHYRDFLSIPQADKIANILKTEIKLLNYKF